MKVKIHKGFTQIKPYNATLYLGKESFANNESIERNIETAITHEILHLILAKDKMLGYSVSKQLDNIHTWIYQNHKIVIGFVNKL